MTLPAWVRLAAGLPMTAAGAALLAAGFAMPGAIGVVLGAMLVLGWFRYADVPRASNAFTAGDRERAWELLEKTPFGGRLLNRPCRVYYHQVRASCLLRWERWEEAARDAEAALRVRSDDATRAASHVSAAQAYVRLGDIDAARRHFAEAKRLPHREALARRLARLAELLGEAAPGDVTGA